MPGRGHNQPPSLVETARAEMDEVLRDYRARVEEMIAASDRVIIKDRADAARAVDLVGLMRDLYAEIETKRLDISRVYQRAASAPIAALEEFWRVAGDRIGRILGQIENFRREEKAEAKRQADAQRAAEAKLRGEAGIAAPVASAGWAGGQRRIKGDYGYSAGSTSTLEITVDDVTKVPVEILNSPKVHAAIVAVARDFAKHMTSVPGLTINRGERTQLRSN